MQKKSKLDAPRNKKAAIQMIAQGRSQAEVSRQLHVSESQVSRFVNHDDIKGLIEEETFSLMECLPDTIENIKGLVRGMKDLPQNDHKARELGYRASLKVSETAGITPVQGQASNVTMILQQNNVDLSPEALKAFEKHLLQDPVIVEAEIE
ncbi:MAG: helix-turn-helix domain-containing protein [Candidatus Bathyarchaeia archaeon]